jgi:hypothetical protein
MYFRNKFVKNRLGSEYENKTAMEIFTQITEN